MQVKVGELFDPRHRYYPFEGPQWRMTAEPISEAVTRHARLLVHVELTLFFHGPSTAEVNLVDSDVPMDFALIPGQHAMMLAHRFVVGNWGDGSWQAKLQTAPAGLPDAAPDEHIAVQVLLIDADTGIVSTYRLTSWPGAFVAAVRDAIDVQLANAGAPDSAAEAELAHWSEDYRTPSELVDNEATLIVRGGKHDRVLRRRTS